MKPNTSKKSTLVRRESRIRTVKPELFLHEGLFDAEQEERLPLRLAFIALFTCCDREGRFRWQPRRLKVQMLPYDDVDMSQVLNAFVRRGFVVKYESKGEAYGCIPSWVRHQNMRDSNESESEFPALKESVPLSVEGSAIEFISTHSNPHENEIRTPFFPKSHTPFTPETHAFHSCSTHHLSVNEAPKEEINEDIFTKNHPVVEQNNNCFYQQVEHLSDNHSAPTCSEKSNVNNNIQTKFLSKFHPFSTMNLHGNHTVVSENFDFSPGKGREGKGKEGKRREVKGTEMKGREAVSRAARDHSEEVNASPFPSQMRSSQDLIGSTEHPLQTGSPPELTMTQSLLQAGSSPPDLTLGTETPLQARSPTDRDPLPVAAWARALSPPCAADVSSQTKPMPAPGVTDVPSQMRSPSDLPAKRSALRKRLSPEPSAIQQVFEHWKIVMQHPNANLDSKRKDLIYKALKCGYDVQQLCEAITGCSYTPHNMGFNDQGQRYDGLHVILRDADQIDRFIHHYHYPPHPMSDAEKRTQSNVQTLQRWAHKKIAEEKNNGSQ